MKQWLVWLIISFLLLGASTIVMGAPKVVPEIELLGGVLSQTSWMNENGPPGSGNLYFQALQDFFSEYSDHEAVKLAEQFTKKGFTYDAPPAFICHLGALPELELRYEYSPYLVKRAGGRNKLEEFRIALRDLAEEMNFLGFFQEWQPYLDGIVEKSVEGFRQATIEQWLEDYFGWSVSEFHLLMTASMFPGGGYGATVHDDAGNLIAFQIIRDSGDGDQPRFPDGVSFENLTIHELGHSFVNPSLEAYPNRAKKLKPLLWPVRKVMRQQAYTTVGTFLNEQVIRAMEVISARDLFTPEIEAVILTYQEERGFYLTSYIVEQLEYYQANRDLYPAFTDFVPYLYDQLDAYQAENSTWADRFFSIFMW